ncbi:coproporphyrinogen III oxidase family protein [bacterium 1xD42-62]|uniref:Heme chaperone HemW n=1 Tax=Parablautia muri TaxID=2320879 RepID=A0A9X5BH41_9FIRM|nr:coproporphyrinogen III oxidase family protein [Parablautia muri]
MNPYVQYMYSYPHKTAYRPLTGFDLKDHVHGLKGPGHGLYLHIPFCQAKCGYCNLFSVTGQGSKAVDRYLDALERQCGQYAELLDSQKTEFSELVIGGGTPLYLTEDQMERMFAMLKEHFHFNEEREFVIETAPNQTTAEKLKRLKQAGATRVSMGIQSFLDKELSALGRQHSAKSAREALNLLKSYQFPCVNLDFIYGIPGQTEGSLLRTLQEALDYEPDEIFLYPLYIKHGAGLEWAGVVPDWKGAMGQYERASFFLKENGFRQDSMRRFVRTDAKRAFSECGFGSSLSLGCGGRSYLGRLHFCRPYAVTQKECLAGIEEYVNCKDYREISHGILLSEEEIKRRFVIRHLLIRPGLPLEQYQMHFGSDAIEDFPLLKKWAEEGYVKRERHLNQQKSRGIDKNNGEPYLALTEKGLAFSDYLGPQLISPQIQRAMKGWEDEHGRIYAAVSGESEKL